MNLVTCHDRIEAALEGPLESFESEFSYPLDQQHRFRISHRPDYLRFFRRMGPASCFVVGEADRVDGVITSVQRGVRLPGSSGFTSSVYLCDLKASTRSKRARVFFTLARAAREYYQGRISSAFGIVMNGTAATPDRYTGVLGIPKFQALGEVAILRLPTTGSRRTAGVVRASVEQARAAFQGLSQDQVVLSSSNLGSGSRHEPVCLLEADGQACGVLSDTLESKRLVCDHQGELVSAHLANFSFTHPKAGLAIVSSAQEICRARGIPALFFAIPKSRLTEWNTHCHFPEATQTGAVIYGLGLPQGLDWNINTSEV